MKAVNFNRKWYERCLVVCFLYASSWASVCFIKKSLIIWLFPLMRISVIPRIVSWVSLCISDIFQIVLPTLLRPSGSLGSGIFLLKWVILEWSFAKVNLSNQSNQKIQIMIKIILNIRPQFASFYDSAVTYYTRRLEHTLIHQHRTSYVTLRQILLVLCDKRDLMFLEIQKHLY